MFEGIWEEYGSTGRQGAYEGETGCIRGWSWDKGQRDKECSGGVQRNHNSLWVSFQTSANYLVYMSECKGRGRGGKRNVTFVSLTAIKQSELPKRYCFLKDWVMGPKLFAIIRIFPIGSAGLDLLDFQHNFFDAVLEVPALRSSWLKKQMLS